MYFAGGGSHVAVNDVTSPEVTGSDPEVTSLDGSFLEVADQGL